MNKLVWLALCLAVLAGCGQRSEWQELTVPDGGFSVLMRGAPLVTPQQTDTPAGRMSSHLYSSDRPDAYFAIGYTDFPLALAVGTAPDKIFAGSRDTWVKRIQGTLVSSSPLKLADKYPGMQFIAEGTYQDRPAIVEARLYLVDQRLYQLVALTRKGEMAQGVVNRYFESFKLIPVTYTEHIKVKPPPSVK